MCYGYYSVPWETMVKEAKVEINALRWAIADIRRVIAHYDDQIAFRENKIKEITINYLGENPMAKVSTSQTPTGKAPIGPKATIPIRREQNQVLRNPNQKQGGKPPGKPIRNL